MLLILPVCRRNTPGNRPTARSPPQRTYFWREINAHIYGVANRFSVGKVEVDRVDRFVMERAQIKAILNFCKRPAKLQIKSQSIGQKVSCLDVHKSSHGFGLNPASKIKLKGDDAHITSTSKLLRTSLPNTRPKPVDCPSARSLFGRTIRWSHLFPI
jgi:hypothetical protein